MLAFLMIFSRVLIQINQSVEGFSAHLASHFFKAVGSLLMRYEICVAEIGGRAARLIALKRTLKCVIRSYVDFHRFLETKALAATVNYFRENINKFNL